MIRILTAMMALVALIPMVAQAQGRYEGEQFKATRAFEATGLRDGALTFSFTVSSFDTEDHAEAAFAKVRETIQHDMTMGLTDLTGASAPKVGDEQTALVGNLSAKARSFEWPS